MVSSRNLVILFTRYPRPGKCKTRLHPELGQHGAAQLHRQLVSRSMKTLATFSVRHPGAAYHIYYDGASAAEMKQWLGEHRFHRQQGEDLGIRMAEALIAELKDCNSCLLMGSDCPAISPELLEEGFRALQTHDLILGPSHDGGYYLIGVNKASNAALIRQLFQGIPWGSDKVLQATIQRAHELHIQFFLLQTLHDIDTPDDLKYFHHHSCSE